MRKLLALLALMFLFGACSKKLEPIRPAVAEGEELYCLADSEEEALRIAASYQIELVRYSDGVATFHTEKDPREVIKEGIAKGLKELSLNRINKLD